MATTRLRSPRAVRLDFLNLALSQRGVPYVWGGESPGKAFDCSGLVQWAAAQVGVSLPHNARDQFYSVPSTKHPQPGDLVFFNVPTDGPSSTQPGHVGICTNVGCTTMVNAPHTGADVDVVPTDPQGWGSIMGYGTLAGIGTGPVGPVGPVSATGRVAATGPTATARGDAAGCAAKGNVFGEGGVLGVGSFSFTYCEAKALLGGLLTVAGGFIMLSGVLIVVATAASGTRAAKVAAGAAAGGIEGGASGAVAGGVSSSRSKVAGAAHKRVSSRPDADDKLAERHDAELRAEGQRARTERGRSAMKGTSRPGVAPASSGARARTERRQSTRKVPTGDF